MNADERGDEIVEELRKRREAYAEKSDYDLDAMARELKAQEKQSDRPIVSFEPKRPAHSVAKSGINNSATQ